MSTDTTRTQDVGHRAALSIGSVVIGEDGSPGGRAALRWAAGHTTDELHLVRAVSPSLELLEASIQVESSALVDQARAEVDAAAQEVAAVAPTVTPTVTTHVIEDAAPNALIDLARRCEVDAIVVGSNGHERFGHLVGANIGRLLHLSEIPVIIVPDGVDVPDAADADVVVGASGDAEADARLISWARGVTPPGTPVRVLHAISPALLSIVSTLEGSVALERRADDHIAALIAGDDAARGSVVVEHALPALVEASASASLLVVGSHRSSRTTGFLTGSIAQHLPTLSHCPVALVPMSAMSGEGGASG